MSFQDYGLPSEIKDAIYRHELTISTVSTKTRVKSILEFMNRILNLVTYYDGIDRYYIIMLSSNCYARLNKWAQSIIDTAGDSVDIDIKLEDEIRIYDIAEGSPSLHLLYRALAAVAEAAVCSYHIRSVPKEFLHECWPDEYVVNKIREAQILLVLMVANIDSANNEKE